MCNMELCADDGHIFILLIFFFFFFFYCYGDHRDLHSFPTRRSSDLVRRQHGERRKWHRALESRRSHRRSVRRCPALGAKEQDRKSTRLNSSHPSISYAVFCLKKKKQKHTHNLQQHDNMISSLIDLAL